MVAMGQVSTIRRVRSFLAFTVGGLAIVAILAVLLGPAAWWVAGDTVAQLTSKDRADAINDVRQTILQAVGGLALLTGLAFTARTYYLSRASHKTEIQGRIN